MRACRREEEVEKPHTGADGEGDDDNDNDTTQGSAEGPPSSSCSEGEMSAGGALRNYSHLLIAGPAGEPG